jgi:hypothetical protein
VIMATFCRGCSLIGLARCRAGLKLIQVMTVTIAERIAKRSTPASFLLVPSIDHQLHLRRTDMPQMSNHCIGSSTLRSAVIACRERGSCGARRRTGCGDVIRVLPRGIGVEATPDSLFQIGSINKIWTNACSISTRESPRTPGFPCCRSGRAKRGDGPTLRDAYERHRRRRRHDRRPPMRPQGRRTSSPVSPPNVELELVRVRDTCGRHARTPPASGPRCISSSSRTAIGMSISEAAPRRSGRRAARARGCLARTQTRGSVGIGPHRVINPEIDEVLGVVTHLSIRQAIVALVVHSAITSWAGLFRPPAASFLAGAMTLAPIFGLEGRYMERFASPYYCTVTSGAVRA